MAKLSLMRLCIPFIIICFFSCQPESRQLAINGVWQFAIDGEDQGKNDRWFDKTFKETIELPGSMMEQDKGYAPTLSTRWTGSIYDSSWYFNPAMEKYRQPGNLKFPFWLTPGKYYSGAAWYQKEVTIPKGWKNKQIFLHLERPHWETTVWINGQEAGMQNSLSTPHQYNITQWAKPGKNKIAIRVDNRIKEINVGPDSHSLTDHTQGNWNGIIGKITLQAQPNFSIKNVRVYPDYDNKKAKVRITFNTDGVSRKRGKIELKAKAFNTNARHSVSQAIGPMEFTSEALVFELQMGEKMLAWDEFSPALYSLEVILKTQAGTDKFETTFGMRKFGIDGTQFTVNGRKVFLRGNVDCAAFPLTGYPPTDLESWLKIFRQAKAYGLNHMRYHSWCPPEAAFEAADLTGFYLQPEGPSWPNHGTSIGNDLPVDQYLLEESERIVDQYGNHASFCMMACGNEPAGRNQVKYLTNWINHMIGCDSTKLYTSASIGRSWPLTPASQFIVRSEPRGLPWSEAPQSMFDYRDKLAPYTVPYVAHEMGQYCVFPNFDEIEKYTGVYKALNFELFRENLHEKRMGMQARDFFMASGKFQALCYKNEIEAALRTPGFAGFQLLGLNDFPGQGSAIVGVTDAFWEPKEYILAEEFRTFCSETVLLARIPKFVYTTSDTLIASIEIAHYGPQALNNRIINWEVYQQDKSLATGELTVGEIKTGGNTKAGNILFALHRIETPAHLVLKTSMGKTENEWEFWVYPSDTVKPESADIHFCNQLDSKAIQLLAQGGKVFLNAAWKVENGKDVVQYFRPVFWNTSWFQMKPPHTTGILCDPEHPALALFPTQFHSNLQWWEILHNQQVMILDGFPEGFKPIVQPIDTWFLNRKLGLVFEAKVGNGKLMVCSADLFSSPEKRPAARQLLLSLVNYMKSPNFKPEVNVDIEVVKELFEMYDRTKIDFHTQDSPDELKPKISTN